MISKEYIELINKDVDKIISPAEKEKLQKYMINNPEARNYYDDLQLLSAYMEKIPEKTPPNGLIQRITNSINFNKYQRKTKTADIHLSVFNKLRLLAPRFGYMFIGMFIGFFIFALVSNDASLNEDDVKGTIGIENKKFQNVKTLEIKNKDISGTVTLMRSGDTFWFDIELNSVNPFRLNINYQDEVELVDFSPNTLSFTKKYNTLEFDKSSGSQQFTVYFSKLTDSALLSIQISQSGNLLLKEAFQVK